MTYTPRHAERLCRDALQQHKILVLIGARQTGKSTLARELLRGVDDADKLLLNLDDPFLRDRLVSTEGHLREMIEDKAGRPWSAMERRFHLVIDEAQKAPRIFEIIKALYDEDPGVLSIIMTGSSALAIHDPVAETLAGRARIIRLPPFTMAEGFAHSRGDDPTRDELPGIVSRLLNGRFGTSDFNLLRERATWHGSDRRRFARDHLRFPLFPEPSPLSEPETWLTDYLATYLEKDVQSLATVGDLALFRACTRQIAARVGSTLKWETMAQEVGTTSTTMRRYIGLMEQTFTLIRLAPFTVNPVKRVIRAPKAYLVDGGLLWALRGFEDQRLLEASGMLGAYMEAAAIIEISKWCSLEPTAPELRFWSKTAVSEVDLVVSNRGYHIPIECKLADKINRKWLRGLDAFESDHQSLGLHIPYRILLTMGQPERPDERTFALPLWALT